MNLIRAKNKDTLNKVVVFNIIMGKTKTIVHFYYEQTREFGCAFYDNFEDDFTCEGPL